MSDEMNGDAGTDPTGATPPSKWSRRVRSWKFWLLTLLVVFVLIQFVPYGHAHDNPPVKTEPAWVSPKIEQMATEACADCHSNLTTWPAYSNVAPGSWLIQHDVEEGRSKMNWSEGCVEVDELSEVVTSGEMPPIQYKLLHPGARLSDSEAKQLAAGLAKSIRDSSDSYGECEGGGD